MGRTLESLRVLNSMEFNVELPRDVTADRSTATWYKNDSRYPLHVQASTETDGSAASDTWVRLHINDEKSNNRMGTDRSQSSDSANSVPVWANIGGIVPPGHFYKCQTGGSSLRRVVEQKLGADE